MWKGGSVGAHGQQLVKATVAVHQVTAKENDNALNTVGLAQELGLLCQELQALGCHNVDVWRKGIDTDVFNPAFNVSNGEMRSELSEGEPGKPLLLKPGSHAPPPFVCLSPATELLAHLVFGRSTAFSVA